MGTVTCLLMAGWKKVWFPSQIGRILSPMKTYSVLLADDHQILLDGLRTLVESNKMFDVKNMASTGTDALNFLKKTDYDILVTDYEMPGLTGLELVKAARTLQPEIKIIVLSMHDDPAVVREMLREGANAYILKKDSHRSLQDALQKVIDGKRFLSEEVSEILIHADDPEEKGTLTSRETEVLRLVAKEFNSRQIAEILFISERTVETHRKNILRKTGASNLVGLIKYAYANNLI
jgi:two-component system, NarL family, nitrate/nitrite response regulator NarL